MDKTRFFLEFLSKMALYSNLQFLYCGETKNYDDVIERTFDGFGIQYNHESQIEFAIDDDVPKVYSGSYVFISKPGYFFHYGIPANGTPRDHRYVTFEGERVNEYLAAGLLDTAKPELISIHQPVRFAQIIHLLHLEYSRDRNSDKAINLLERLLFLLQEEKSYQSESSQYYEKILIECEEYIIAHPEREHDFRSWAKKAGVSYAHFRRLFQQHCGSAPKSFILHNRFNTAVRYLLESDKRISEIAELCGWEDVYFFSKQFKKKFGISPLQFRKNGK